MVMVNYLFIYLISYVCVWLLLLLLFTLTLALTLLLRVICFFIFVSYLIRLCRVQTISVDGDDNYYENYTDIDNINYLLLLILLFI